MSQLTRDQRYYVREYAKVKLNLIKNNNATTAELKDELIRLLSTTGRQGKIGGVPVSLISAYDKAEIADSLLDELIKPLEQSTTYLLKRMINSGWDNRDAIANELENNILLQVRNPGLAVEITDWVLINRFDPLNILLGFQDSGTMSALTSVGLLLTLGLTWALFRKK
jgi:hypothetical protein